VAATPSPHIPPANPHLPDEGLGVPEDSVQRSGHTSPADSGVSCLDAPEREALSHGWAASPLVVIGIVVALFAAGALGMAIELML
jgi:uncharacterized protein DUF6480